MKLSMCSEGKIPAKHAVRSRVTAQNKWATSSYLQQPMFVHMSVCTRHNS